MSKTLPDVRCKVCGKKLGREWFSKGGFDKAELCDKCWDKHPVKKVPYNEIRYWICPKCGETNETWMRKDYFKTICSACETEFEWGENENKMLP